MLLHHLDKCCGMKRDNSPGEGAGKGEEDYSETA